jgi:hypothetical protein
MIRTDSKARKISGRCFLDCAAFAARCAFSASRRRFESPLRNDHRVSELTRLDTSRKTSIAKKAPHAQALGLTAQFRWSKARLYSG